LPFEITSVHLAKISYHSLTSRVLFRDSFELRRRSKAVPTSNAIDSTPTIQDKYGFNRFVVGENARASTCVSVVSR
jgi:hypothetical protein